MQSSPLSLIELNQEIKSILKENTKKKYWVIGEISELKVNYSGHCYLELIQKDESSDQIIARSRATIWAPAYRMIKPYFETTTGQTLREDLGILVKVSVEFHEVYGLSLNITDIEPTYTVGELAIKKQKIIERLTEEGVIEMNKELEFPVPCQKIAVISSLTAAGFEDFADQILNNPFGYKFYLRLFPAVMQGEDAEKSIIAALDTIYQYESVFDAVVIIRGGGSQADLSCFDSYWLAYHITQFPLPVFTGIGHEQDDSVTDLVAHTRLKTPTAVATFLIDQAGQLHAQLEEITERIFSQILEILEQYNKNLYELTSRFHLTINEFVFQQSRRLEQLGYRLSIGSKQYMNKKQTSLLRNENQLQVRIGAIIRTHQYKIRTTIKLFNHSIRHLFSSRFQSLELQESRIIYLDPKQILKRGYSITKYKNKILTNASLTEPGEHLETQLFKGIVKSKIIK